MQPLSLSGQARSNITALLQEWDDAPPREAMEQIGELVRRDIMPRACGCPNYQAIASVTPAVPQGHGRPDGAARYSSFFRAALDGYALRGPETA